MNRKDTEEQRRRMKRNDAAQQRTKDEQKRQIIKNYLHEIKDFESFVDYFEKYRKYLSKNTFNNLSKDIITF